MSKFVKKPLPVECKQLLNDDECIISIFEWITGEDTSTSEVGRKATLQTIKDEDGINIETLEGTMHASFGDWVIQGIHGEFYPCKPDIFAESYEPYKFENLEVHDKVDFEDLANRVKTTLVNGYNYTLSPEIRNDINNLFNNLKSKLS